MELSDARWTLMMVLGILWRWNAGRSVLSLFSSLGCFHVGMLWYVIQWPMSGPWWSAIGYWVNTPHIPAALRWKLVDTKRSTHVPVRLFVTVPNKIWFYAGSSPVRQGERVIQCVVCGYVADRTGVILLWNPGPRPGVSVLYRPACQPPAGSQPAAPSLPGPDRGLLMLSAYSPLEGLGCCLFLSNKIMSRECWDNEQRGQVSNSYRECGNQERPGQQQPSLVSKDAEIKCQFLISNLQFSSLRSNCNL